ncbi:MAG: hypothetical protein ACI9EH_000526, partial [Planktomarina sp.]
LDWNFGKKTAIYVSFPGSQKFTSHHKRLAVMVVNFILLPLILILRPTSQDKVHNQSQPVV